MPISSSLPLRRWLAPLFALLLLGASGCAADNTIESAAVDATFPVTVSAGNGNVVVNDRPERIVSLSPTATEMLFAIGADEQVVAVDDQSSYPAEAPRTELSGFTPNVEAIAGYRPDLVVISDDLGGVLEGLNRLNIPVLLEPTAKTLDDSYDQVRDLGTATGNTAAATALAADMRRQIEGHLPPANQPAPTTPVKIYHEADPTLYSASSKTFIGGIYDRFNLTNVADAADSTGSGYPQLSAEYLVQANPDLIFLADTKCCGQSQQTVAARPGFADIAAVRNSNVIALDDDIASRWGPRLVELVATIDEAVKKTTKADKA